MIGVDKITLFKTT